MNAKALYKISYGLYVVSSRKEDKLNGQIANTVFQITSEPPTIAVSINKTNLTHEYIMASRVFSVSVLCQSTPLNFIGRFGFKSGREINKLEGVGHKIGSTKAPIVTDHATAYMEAEVLQSMDMGTHTIFAGRLVDADMLTEEPCMTYEYYREMKRGTAPPTAPTYMPPAKEARPKTAKYRCRICGYIYDPEMGDAESGIKAGTAFEQLPDTWLCPICGAAKDQFDRIVE